MIAVLEAGGLTSVQDGVGRAGWRHLGVPVGGAADRWSARLANRLAGNADSAGLLEMTLDGPTLRFEAAGVAAITGPLAATVGGVPMVPNAARFLSAGAVLRVGSGPGARGYLAVAGGIACPRVLGSVATDLRSGFGGLDGRPLRPGDRLAIGSEHGPAARWTGQLAPRGPIRVVAGPHDEGMGRLEVTWRVGVETDRTGLRLDGDRLVMARDEVPSMGLPLGAIQVPLDGRPIVMLVDGPVTGGYPVPACVIRADIGRVAQLRPGDEARFASVSPEEARSALRRAEDELAALEMLDAPAGDDELAWIGSHE